MSIVAAAGLTKTFGQGPAAVTAVKWRGPVGGCR